MTFSQTPHLVVQRSLDNGTNLHEFWVLDSAFWYDEDNMTDDPPVQVYVAPWSGTRDVTNAGIPPKSDAAHDSCHWSDTPKEVKDQFRDEANRIQQFTALLQAGDDA